MYMATFQIDERTRQFYASMVLLNHMVSTNQSYDILLKGNQIDLEPTLMWLLTHKTIEINNKNHYQVTKLGKSIIEKFHNRYQKTLQYFDVFAAVDLTHGDFALASYPEFESTQQWLNFLHDERWDDLRVAVATQLKADPIEIVFAHFMNEGRFDLQSTAWELSLKSGLIWQEISEICQSSLQTNDLGYDDIDGSQVLNDVIEQGFTLIRELSDEDPALMSHLARWFPRHGESHSPDHSPSPFWQEPWAIELPNTF